MDGMRLATPREANSLSPVYAAKDLYKRSLSLCPLVTYKKGTDGGRTRAETHPAYSILHDAPNNVQNRITFTDKLCEDYFTHGEFFGLISWKANNNLHAIYALPHCSIVDVKLVTDEKTGDWRKAFFIREENQQVVIHPDTDIIHIIKDHRDDLGVRGRPIFDFAAENLGLHRQVLESADAYYRNAASPSMYVNRLNPPALDTLVKEEKNFNENFAGVRNSGKVPFVSNSEINSFPGTSAEKAQLIEALNTSVADVARWFGVSPLLLADLSRGTYSNLAADNSAFYQRSLQPLMEKIQLEVNLKLFGAGSDTYAEFLTAAVLRGDPMQQQAIINGYIVSGVMTPAEGREMLNLPPIPGLDTPMRPVNQAVVTGAQDAQPLKETNEDSQQPIAS